MSAPFKPGDVVVCVDVRAQTPANTSASLLRRGALYRVVKVGRTRVRRVPAVWLQGLPSHDLQGSFSARRFREIDDETTEEFREQMRALRKLKERTGA